MSLAHEKGHYRELDLDALRDLVRVRVKITPEDLWKSWDEAETTLAGFINRTDLAPEVRAYLEDLLQEVNRQREIAAHKELRPVLRELKPKGRP